MSGEGAQLAALLATEMRGPLARIELASSELEQLVRTPRARDLTDRVSQAVAAINELVSQTISVLQPAAPDRDNEDVWPTLRDLHTRFAAVLAARGIHWSPPQPPARPVLGNALRVRQAGVRLLSLPGGAHTISIRLVEDGPRYGLTLAGPTEDASEELRVFALGLGGELASTRDTLTVWLPRNARS